MGRSTRLVDGQVNRRLRIALSIIAGVVLAGVALLAIETFLTASGDW